MKFKAPAVEELKNESDVEQKLMYPLLTAELPYGLGFAGASVLTKHNIRALSINKGRSTKSYFPDYLITQQDYPLIVVEAKTPGEDLVEAYREARLYSQEINALFPAGINPCVKVIATDGMIFLAGNSDELEPCIELKLEDLIPASELFAKFVEGFSVKAVSHLCEKYDALLKPSYLKKPRRIIGGKALQN
ncbi:type I restriction endonuclease, partial [Ectopseudomonas oleovorans]